MPREPSPPVKKEGSGPQPEQQRPETRTTRPDDPQSPHYRQENCTALGCWGLGAVRALSTVPPGRCSEPGAREGEGVGARRPDRLASELRDSGLARRPPTPTRPALLAIQPRDRGWDSLRLAQRLVPIPPFIPDPVLTSARSCLGFHTTPIPNQVLRLILEGGELLGRGEAGSKALNRTVFIGHYLPKCRSHSAVPSRPPQNLPRGRRARGSRAELPHPESPILSGVSLRAPA